MTISLQVEATEGEVHQWHDRRGVLRMLELSSDMLIIVRVFLAYLSRCESVQTPHKGK